jgi:hypothetical protein
MAESGLELDGEIVDDPLDEALFDRPLAETEAAVEDESLLLEDFPNDLDHAMAYLDKLAQARQQPEIPARVEAQAA